MNAMNQEKLHEGLSALMDGEASELQMHQVLKQSENTELRQQWQRWQMIRSALHGETQSLAPLDLATRVSAALDAQTMPPAHTQPSVRSRLWGGIGQLAIAASVTLTVLGGAVFYQSSQQAANHPPLQARQGDMTPPPGFALPLMETPKRAGYAGNEASHGQESLTPYWIGEQPDWQAERLPTYLYQHHQQGGLHPALGGMLHVRTASFSE